MYYFVPIEILHQKLEGQKIEKEMSKIGEAKNQEMVLHALKNNKFDFKECENCSLQCSSEETDGGVVRKKEFSCNVKVGEIVGRKKR